MCYQSPDKQLEHVDILLAQNSLGLLQELPYIHHIRNYKQVFPLEFEARSCQD